MRVSEVSITPVSDIVLEVAKAADPAKYRKAAERLSGGTEAGAVESRPFGLALRSAGANFSSTPGPAVSKPVPKPDAGKRAYSGLEQLVWKSLIENMLPKESAVLFGSGTGGDVWRSMLADQLAAGIGKTGDLGAAHRDKPAAYPTVSKRGGA